MTVYASDPNRQPDTEFVAGELSHLVVGNAGRLLDARRTPIKVSGVVPQRGAFAVEICAFEDVGARWELPLEDISRFQFARGVTSATSGVLTRLEEARVRFSEVLVIGCDPAARAVTLGRIAQERTVARGWLAGHAFDASERRGLIARRGGDSRLFGALEGFLAQRGLADQDRRFAARFVSNPRSGELIKGHAIVLAELGLCPYHGQIVRDPDLFDDPWSKRRRAEHLIARLALIAELWSSWGQTEVTLYRGAAFEGSPSVGPASSFVSATFSRQVAVAHFDGGPTTQTAVLWRQAVPVGRLFMTFLETRAMNGRFREAEAVLVSDPANRAF